VEAVQEPDCVQETDVHLYVLQAGSALLDHLQSGWRARILVSLSLDTMYTAQLLGSSINY
jgi:hypothetical protein